MTFQWQSCLNDETRHDRSSGLEMSPTPPQAGLLSSGGLTAVIDSDAQSSVFLLIYTVVIFQTHSSHTRSPTQRTNQKWLCTFLFGSPSNQQWLKHDSWLDTLHFALSLTRTVLAMKTCHHCWGEQCLLPFWHKINSFWSNIQPVLFSWEWGWGDWNERRNIYINKKGNSPI